MAITVDWGTKVISIPLADLDFVSGTIYNADTNAIRLELKALEATYPGMPYERITNHNTEITIAGTTFARTIEIVNGYSIQFTPDTQATVILGGSNNNFFDVESGILIQNQVQIIATNSAGLQTVVQGSGVTAQDKIDIANQVFETDITPFTTLDSFGEFLNNKILTVSKFLGLK